MENSPKRARKPKFHETFEEVFELSLRTLSRTDITALRLRQKLLQKPVSRAQIEPVIERLLELGLLDDFNLAKNVAAGHPSWSKLRLKQALYEKGVPKDISEEVLAEIDDEAEYARCERAFLKQNADKIALEDKNYRMKIFNSMLRRGFKANMIASVMDADDFLK